METEASFLDPLEPGLHSCLNASITYLSYAKFDKCKTYAIKALKSDDKHPGPPQLLAIAGVLSSATGPEPPDWYNLIDLPRFTRNPNIIRARLDLLKDLVNPRKNPYPFAKEAQDWVYKAASILSDPKSKSQFDRDLKMRQKEGEKGATFWTVCPYCYFMYEYPRVYVDCVLRCQNVKCRRAFTAVAVAASAVPTPEVAEKGKYICNGFLPVGAEKGGDKGWKWWEPFVSLVSGSSSLNQGHREARTNEGRQTCPEVIDLTDGDEMAGLEEEKIKERGDVNNGGNVVMKREIVAVKRKKVAAVGKKKVLGKGVRANWNPSSPMEGSEGDEFMMDEEGNRDGAKTSQEQEGSGSGTGGVRLDFSEGDGDIFVSLNSVSELGFGASLA